MSNRTINNLFWSAIERFSVQGFQFLLSMIIARLVLPSDFGLIAMLGIFMGIAQTVIDSGFSSALIQKQNRTETDYATVFYFNIIIGVIMYGFLYASAPFIASFYNEPRLDFITKIMGINLLLNSLAVVQRAKLTIALNFKMQAYISFFSIITSGIIGIWIAYNNYGVWALITQSLLNNFLNTLLLWILTRWMPLFTFSWDSFKTLFLFGSKLLLSGFLHTIYLNMYTLVIGKRFLATDLGYYNRAAVLSQTVSGTMTDVLIRVAYPSLCQIQNDEQQLRDSFIIYIRSACFIVFPIMIGICALAKPIIVLLLTEKWLPAVILLQILCIAYMWDVIMRFNAYILNVRGRTDYTLKSEIWKKSIAIFILLCSLPWGLKIICISTIIYVIADLSIIMHYVKKVINITFLFELKLVCPVLLLSSSMGVLVYASTFLFDSHIIQLLAGGLLGISYYTGMSWLFRFKELSLLSNILNIRKNNKNSF